MQIASIKSRIRRFLPECLYGGMDGIITTFAIIAGVAGAGYSISAIVVLGVAGVIADAFSMASANYVSQRSTCNIGKEDCEPYLPLKTAVVTFSSFLIAGTIPLLPYVVAITFSLDTKIALISSVTLAFFLFFIIGYVDGAISKTQPFWTGFKTFLIGAMAASIAYGVSTHLSAIFPEPQPTNSVAVSSESLHTIPE